QTKARLCIANMTPRRARRAEGLITAHGRGAPAVVAHAGVPCYVMARNSGRRRIFAIGQRVRHKTRALKGSVLEVDGGTVYLEAENGVEMQFALGDIEDDGPGRSGP